MWKFFTLFLLLFFLIFPTSVSAHSGPPFIQINSVPNQPNPAGSGSVFFKVPNEVAAQSYMINETLKFTIDKTLLPVDPTQIKENDFIWDFANGKTVSGLSSSTQYTKSGSYIVVLKVKDANYPDPIELESMQVNILPNQNATLPTAVIKVNGKQITDPFKEPVLINKNSEIELSATDSKGKIKDYKWDLGDGTELKTGATIKHKFDFSQPYAYSFFPVVRVEDENGLFSDAVVQIAGDEDGENATATDSATASSGNSRLLIYLGIGAVIILIVGSYLFIFKRKK